MACYAYEISQMDYDLDYDLECSILLLFYNGIYRILL